MKTVAIESPFAGEVARNRAYLQDCIRDCLARDLTPYASHQMLTDALRDDDPEQRVIGISAGLQMAATLDQRIFFIDYGWSNGMQSAREYYSKLGLSFQERTIR